MVTKVQVHSQHGQTAFDKLKGCGQFNLAVESFASFNDGELTIRFKRGGQSYVDEPTKFLLMFGMQLQYLEANEQA
jgi:hypothetical protein